VINAGVGERVDVAFFKLCYVDINDRTDIRALFDVYRTTMESLVHVYPDVTFLHVTVPLRRLRAGWSGWMREKFGLYDREREGQLQRHAYNQLLRSHYGASGRVFDLAAEEATDSDGRSQEIHYRGRALPTLVSGYTDDGGHLNRRAAERIAGRLLACIGPVGGCQAVHSRQETLR
jgi:hypothetical protein